MLCAGALCPQSSTLQPSAATPTSSSSHSMVCLLATASQATLAAMSPRWQPARSPLWGPTASCLHSSSTHNCQWGSCTVLHLQAPLLWPANCTASQPVWTGPWPGTRFPPSLAGRRRSLVSCSTRFLGRTPLALMLCTAAAALTISRMMRKLCDAQQRLLRCTAASLLQASARGARAPQMQPRITPLFSLPGDGRVTVGCIAARSLVATQPALQGRPLVAAPPLAVVAVHLHGWGCRSVSLGAACL